MHISNQVRNSDDTGVGHPPEPIVFRIVEGAAEGRRCSEVWFNCCRFPSSAPIHTCHPTTLHFLQDGVDANGGLWGSDEEQRVARGCGCSDRTMVRKVRMAPDNKMLRTLHDR